MTAEEIIKEFISESTFVGACRECTNIGYSAKLLTTDDDVDLIREEFDQNFDVQSLVNKLGHWKIVDEGRCSVDPDKCQLVVYFEKTNTHIMLEGYYSSQEGSNYEDGEWTSAFKKQVIKEQWTKNK